ncbi:MAG: aspartate 1-decarboxylase [Candidatus Eutrophobiaceae bacterium]
MFLNILKCKLHQACVTHARVDYDGSCAIDNELLERANILENEQIHIYNVSNGERLITYAIRAEHGSRVISANGAAAHKAKPGDRIIICSYAAMDEEEAQRFLPTLLYLDNENRIIQIKNGIPVQAA